VDGAVAIPISMEAHVKHLSRILAAVDFSSAADGAFAFALALAGRHGAELMAIQAVPLDLAFNREGDEREALKVGLRQRAADAGVELEYRVQHGDAAEIILLHAHAAHPDLIVIGSHQRRGFDRWYFGSVSERVVARAEVPVLVVPAGLPFAATGAFRHVAVAVDLTTASDAAVARALEAAGDRTERITLLHAVPGFSSGVPRNLYRYGIADYQRQLVRDARRALQLAVPPNRPSRPAIHTRVLTGDTTTELGRIAGTIGADLLVVGVPRRGIVANALFGTTAARLLKAADIPILAVPAASRPRVREEDALRRRAA
jgi:nucleotide-binding universal stress UspA family protein